MLSAAAKPRGSVSGGAAKERGCNAGPGADGGAVVESNWPGKVDVLGGHGECAGDEGGG